MEQEFRAELDALKDELDQIKRLLVHRGLPPVDPHSPRGDETLLGADGKARLNELRDQVLAYTASSGESGAVVYTGTFCTGSGDSTRQSVWASVIPTDFLMGLNEQRMVEKVLASVGNGQRLAILLSLLKAPMTVAQLVDALGANTTGHVYHHLKPLVAANLVQEEKGLYTVIPYRVQGIVMLLAGVWDLVDTRYTSGEWEDKTG